MYRFITLLAASLATANAQYGGSSQPMAQPQQQYGQSQQSSQYGQSSSQYGQSGQQMNSNMGQQWMGMQNVAANMAQQIGVIIIETNAGGSSQWQQQSSSSNMYMQNTAPQTHQVTVGAPGLAYTPNQIMAKPGDYVQFNFQAQNHTVTQSAFTTPCVKMAGGMDSGFMPNMNNGTNPAPALKMQVMTSMPTWFYCRQKTPEGHCGKGMTFAINPTMQKSQAMFQAMAIQQNGTMTSSSAAPPPPMAMATSAAAAVATPASSVVMGQGSMNNGQCQCQCLCGTNAYAPGLGQGMMGGMGGMMPMSPASAAVSAPAGAAPSYAP